eukprot:2543487-Rhodomonas_salina.1
MTSCSVSLPPSFGAGALSPSSCPSPAHPGGSLEVGSEFAGSRGWVQADGNLSVVLTSPMAANTTCTQKLNARNRIPGTNCTENMVSCIWFWGVRVSFNMTKPRAEQASPTVLAIGRYLGTWVLLSRLSRSFFLTPAQPASGEERVG